MVRGIFWVFVEFLGFFFFILEKSFVYKKFYPVYKYVLKVICFSIFLSLYFILTVYKKITKVVFLNEVFPQAFLTFIFSLKKNDMTYIILFYGIGVFFFLSND